MIFVGNLQVYGEDLDHQTRCLHWHSERDIVAIKMKCCGHYYACKDCHCPEDHHPIIRWTIAEYTEKAILCGSCAKELTIEQYLNSNNECPYCCALFNPRCRNHYPFYFESF